MSISGYRTHFLGAVRTGYLMIDPTIEAKRAEIDVNVSEYHVKRVVPGLWSATVGGTAFGSTIADALLSGYVKASTADVPFLGVTGSDAATAAEIVLCNIFSPIGNAGVDAERLARGPLSAQISSREPMTGGKLLYLSDNGTGVTGDTFGTGVSLGAIPAGSEGVFPVVFPHWPTMGGTAAATVELQHSAVGASVNLDIGPAVDKGGGLVGLPSTGHGFVAGQIVRVVGSVNYDGENHTLDVATSINELVIPATYAAETFAGTETVDDLWDAPTTAVETTGTNPFALVAGAPAYTVITIDGDTTPITDTEWRIVITGVTATAWPVAAGAIVTKSW
jgi:hypothetical protein